MKIHTYKGPTDRIPLNAIPFYNKDTAQTITEVEALYKKGILKATEWFDIDTLNRISIDKPEDWEYIQGLLDMYDNDISDIIKYYIENNIIFTVASPNELDWRLCLLCHEKDNSKSLIVDGILWMGMATCIPSYRGFIKLLNEKFKDMGYAEVGYHFPVAHRLKPDLSKEDYDRVLRLGATEDCMGYRVYIKKLG